jgi:hypothetical protein
MQAADQYIRAKLEDGLLNTSSKQVATGRLFALKNTSGGMWKDTQEVKQDLNITDLRGLFDQVQAGELAAIEGGKGKKASNNG